MKKSLLAILIGSLFLSGCNEQEIADLNKQIQEKQQTITALQTENQQLKDKFPSLTTEFETLFDKAETVSTNQAQPQQKNTNEAIQVEDDNLTYNISMAKTNIPWLDNLLLDRLINGFTPANSKAPEGTDRKAVLLKLLEDSYKDAQNQLKSGDTMGVEHVATVEYLGQRNNITSFVLFQHDYSGGAHGMYHSEYINVDTDKKTVLTLDDIVAKDKQDELKKMLWQVYIEPTPQGEEPFVNEQEFAISPEFYFDINGINFVYAPYTIGSYAEGEISLMLPWNEANQILKDEFQR